MDFEEYLEVNAKNIDEELDQILSQFLNETKNKNIKLLPFALGLLNSNRGGKRIRGVLVNLGYELSGGLPNKDILKISSALEILHTAFLIHDDIIDKSPTRRNQPSLYKALGGKHYGISQAISIGDIGLYFPIKLISDSSFLGEYKLKALSLLSEIIVNTGWGQIMDLEKGDKEFINLYKSAQYTIVCPLVIGATLAGADNELLGRLKIFGENLGIAFQIRDDVLDGELDEDSDKGVKYVSGAKKIIPKITSDSKMRRLLDDMAEYMVKRTK